MPPAIQNLLSSALPLPVVIVLLVNAVALTWFASGQLQDLKRQNMEIASRVIALERADIPVANHEARIIILEQSRVQSAEDIAEIKTMLREMKAQHPK